MSRLRLLARITFIARFTAFLWILALFIAACGDGGGGGSGTPSGAVTLIAADRNGDIYLIDSTAATATLVLDTITDDGVGGTTDVGVVSSMLYFADTGVLWIGTGGQGFCGQCIHVLDPTTGDAVYLAGPDTISGLSGLARNSSGEIYTNPGDTDDISSVNPVTGALTSIGADGAVTNAGKGMTFDLYITS